MKKKLSLILIAVVLVSVAVTGGVWAVLHAESEPVTNSFVLKPAIEVLEDFNDKGTVKKNVRVKVTASSEELAIRAKIVVTYQDDNGNVYARQPKLGEDYNMTLNTVAENVANKWMLGSEKNAGFYIYKDALSAGKETQALIESCTPVDTNTPKGYGLCVDVIAQGLDKNAVEEMWGK